MNNDPANVFTLHRMLEVMRNMPGAGHEAVIRTPDGKLWIPDAVTNTWRVDATTDKITTVIEVVERKKQ